MAALRYCTMVLLVAAAIVGMSADAGADSRDTLTAEATLPRTSAQPLARIRQSVTLTENNFLVVGEPSYSSPTMAERGLAQYYRLTETGWSGPVGLLPSSSTPLHAYDHYGYAVSAIDAELTGGRPAVLVGAPGDDQRGIRAGAVYLRYLKCSTMPINICYWAQDKWYSPDAQPGGEFGKALELDQDIAVVGAPGEGVGGQAHVYLRDLNTTNVLEYDHEAILAMDTPAAGDEFGTAVAVEDGYVAVGAPGRDSRGYTDLGAVAVFRHACIFIPGRGISCVWSLLDTLEPPDDPDNGPHDNTRFGTSVAITGRYLFVSAPGYNGPIPIALTPMGKVFAYRISTNSVEFLGPVSSGFNCGYQMATAGDYLAVRSAGSLITLPDPLGNGGSREVFRDSVALYEYDPAIQQWVAVDGGEVGVMDTDPGIFGGVGVNARRIVADVPYDGRAEVFKICPWTDLNGDCTINLADLAILAADWLR